MAEHKLVGACPGCGYPIYEGEVFGCMALIGTHKDGCEADMEEGLFDKPEAVTVPGGEVGA